FNHRIRRVKADGTTDTFAGSGTTGFLDGTATVARFQQPADVALAVNGTLYVADRMNHRIRAIAADGSVTTAAGQGTGGFLDGDKASARFNNPEGIAIDAKGNLIVADRSNHRIRKVDLGTGAVITLAGDGTAAFLDGGVAQARFSSPSDVFVLAGGDILVADSQNHRIRLLKADKVETLAGDGTAALKDGAAASAQFHTPSGVAADSTGRIVVADAGNHALRSIESGAVSTIAGTGQFGFKDGTGQQAQLNKPSAIAIDATGNLFIADSGNNRIRMAKAAKKVCNDGNPCTKDSCDKATGACIFDTLQPGDACDDGSACTVGDVCDLAGQCGGKGKTCDDSSPCTDDACDPATGDCVYKNLNKACDDGDACTKGDVCVGGACVSGPGAVDTLAGSGSASFLDGAAATARFYYPEDVTVDAAGNAYIADNYNHRIRKITKDGQVSTLAGTGSASFQDGAGNVARFYYPAGVAVDDKGTVFVADRSNHRIRAVAADGTTTTVAGNGSASYADGKGSSAKFNSPQGIDIDPNGNLYVADTGNQRVRKIDSTGVVTTVAGQAGSGWVDGPANNAKFSNPYDVLFGSKGEIFVADYSNHRIRAIAPDGSVSTLAGSGSSGTTDGIGTNASFSSPSGLSLDANGNLLVVTRSGHRIRRVTPQGEVATIVGSAGSGYGNGAPGTAKLNSPAGIALAPDGTVLIADRNNHRIRRMASTKTICVDNQACTVDSCDKQTGKCDFVTIAAGGACDDGNGCTTGEKCDGKGGCSGGTAKACDDKNSCTNDSCNAFSGDCVFTPTEGLCSDGLFCTVNDRCSAGACVGDGREVSTLAGQAAAGHNDGKGASAQFNNPRGVAVDLQGNVWIADYGTHTIRRATSKGIVSTVAGGPLSNGYVDGQGNAARFYYPSDVASDGKSGVYVADRSNQRIRHVTAGGVVTTIAGSGSATFVNGTGTAASFNTPEGIAFDQKNGDIYVADTNNHRIRKIDGNKAVTLHAGSGSSSFLDGAAASARFYYPRGIAVDGKGRVWVADGNNHRIRRIENGQVTTVAGNGTTTYADGKGAAAKFYYPYALAISPDGGVWVADRSNHRIRRVLEDGTVDTVAGSGTGGYKDADALEAMFNAPQGIAIDKSFNVYISEAGNQRIRRMATPFNDCDDGTECTDNACDETKDTCSSTPVTDGAACIDGKPCLGKRLCNQGFCVGGVPKDCDDSNTCTLDSCNEATGECEYKADPAKGCTVSRRAFVTNEAFAASLGGVTGAHAKCQAAASAANLGGTWLAWIADSTTYPSIYHDKSTVPYRRLDGGLIALNWNDLVDGTLDNPIDVTELGSKVPTTASTSYCGSNSLPSVWTGTNTAGNRANSTSSIYYCSNWNTTTTSSSYRGASGNATLNNSAWTTSCTTQRCNYKGHLYCFEQTDYWSK
ncbi:MAG: SMP-30/gluconolactonase/LRE family protein, partial [Deltaproteobacteria bacterium]|nr:SMP-30/gluconolactonase/LRE family protein [Deltaproteobacteria bacterium]